MECHLRHMVFLKLRSSLISIPIVFFLSLPSTRTQKREDITITSGWLLKIFPDVDILIRGMTNFAGQKGPFDLEVFNSTPDYVNLKKSVFHFEFIKKLLAFSVFSLCQVAIHRVARICGSNFGKSQLHTWDWANQLLPVNLPNFVLQLMVMLIIIWFLDEEELFFSQFQLISLCQMQFNLFPYAAFALKVFARSILTYATLVPRCCDTKFKILRQLTETKINLMLLPFFLPWGHGRISRGE